MRFKLYQFITNLFMKSRVDWKKTTPVSDGNTLWFHAASSGELEILIPIIEAAVSEKRNVCVSIFSESAESWLKRLPKELLYAGFSPAESAWGDVFAHFGVRELITSKYEAWPGLWRAASISNIRISVVCAQMRSSLLWAKRLLAMMGIRLPRLRFFVLDEHSIPELKENFPDSECVVAADPRWLRVLKRAEKTDIHESFQKWRLKHIHTPKPYWVIGSAWKEDMNFLSNAIRLYPGTVWVVPHSLKQPPDPSVFAPHSNCVLVDEMGLLVELYSIADRAWVGGGFGEGIHSTLEPAVYSIPIACGPKNVENFHETKELIGQGLLTVCRSEDEVQKWMHSGGPEVRFSLKSKLEVIEQMVRAIVK